MMFCLCSSQSASQPRTDYYLRAEYIRAYSVRPPVLGGPTMHVHVCTLYSVCNYVLLRRLAGIPAKNCHAFLSANYYSLGVVSQCTPLDQEHVLEHVCFIRGYYPRS